MDRVSTLMPFGKGAIAVLVSGVLLAVPIGGCGGEGSSAPTTSTQARARTSAPVTLTTHVFLRGMKLTVPTRRWQIVNEVSDAGEVNLAAPPGAMHGTTVKFWLDPRAAKVRGGAVRGVGSTPAALVAWLRKNRNFAVTVPTRRNIAGGVAATSVDLNVAASAPKEDPSCDRPCVTEFTSHSAGYDNDFGSGRGEPLRLYFATVHQGGHAHTLLVIVDTPSAKAFRAAAPVVQQILEMVKLPAGFRN